MRPGACVPDPQGKVRAFGRYLDLCYKSTAADSIVRDLPGVAHVFDVTLLRNQRTLPAEPCVRRGYFFQHSHRAGR